jgi:hypothetical protein
MIIGPYLKESTFGILTPNPTTKEITFPATEINYNHIFIGLGFGINIYMMMFLKIL